MLAILVDTYLDIMIGGAACGFAGGFFRCSLRDVVRYFTRRLSHLTEPVLRRLVLYTCQVASSG